MIFVNERISQEDVKKFDLEAIDQNFIVGGTNARDWTIDRARNIYLRNVSNGREEYRSQSGWTLFWGGQCIYLELEILEAGGAPGAAGWARRKLHAIEIPEQLIERRAEILDDLKAALIAYKDFGVFSVCTDYTLTLVV